MSKPSATPAGNHGTPPTAITLPGIILGVGLGGFVDGILLHQILQWHHMLSSSVTANINIGSYPVDHRPRAADEHPLGRVLPHHHLAGRAHRSRDPVLPDQRIPRPDLGFEGPVGLDARRLGDSSTSSKASWTTRYSASTT